MSYKERPRRSSPWSGPRFLSYVCTRAGLDRLCVDLNIGAPRLDLAYKAASPSPDTEQPLCAVAASWT